MRYLKRDLRALRLRLEAATSELSERRRCGLMMSNLCFNLAQDEKIEARHRDTMAQCWREWDAIRRWEADNAAK